MPYPDLALHTRIYVHRRSRVQQTGPQVTRPYPYIYTTYCTVRVAGRLPSLDMYIPQVLDRYR